MQFTIVGEMLRVLMHPEQKANDGQRHISSFEAFVVALASRIGAGRNPVFSKEAMPEVADQLECW